MIRGLGKNIVSAADLIAQFEATLTDDQIKSHFAARDVMTLVTAEAFKEIGRPPRAHGGTHVSTISRNFSWKRSRARTRGTTTLRSWP